MKFPLARTLGLCLLAGAPVMAAPPAASISGSLIWTNPQPNTVLGTNRVYGGYMFYDYPNNAFGFICTNGYSWTWTNGILYTVSPTNVDWAISGVFTGSLSISNLVPTVLAATSNKTNYTATLAGQGTSYLLYPANTNVFLSLLGTNQLGNVASINFDNRTSTIPSTVTFCMPAHSVLTNLTMGAFASGTTSSFVVTNGQAVTLSLWNINASGTNLQAYLTAPCIPN